ncbi:dihydroorotate dehydrogenase electron transfer subunit [Candidatus Solincola tengchongensis]|uniref:dihydroorotate dehydrogenase electron transfer subunit n=1 Tax=Candidatus Solincola tengchongensis TaxID=2900693 RepID=UPI00257E31EB|nr:dihydroorotate dehydrogenase electron transfer subunit [Candidatus Solincola tengchongensis]
MPPLAFRSTVLERRDYGCASEVVFRVGDGFSPLPGQFVHLLCGGGGRIIRRPFSVFRHEGGIASVLVREVGGGTAWLRRRRRGDELDILGPLGRGFDLTGGGEHVLLAGGIGVAPLAYLGRRLTERGGKVTLLWGMEKGTEYGSLPESLGEEFDLHIATADGSRGKEGTVLELLSPEMTPGTHLFYACGPRSMLVALTERLSAAGLPSLQVSVEERMACGLGACRGCAVPAVEPPGGYLAACRDGPVFRAEELDWKRMMESI